MPAADNRHAVPGPARQTTRPPVAAAGEDIWAPDLGRRSALWSRLPGGLDQDTADMLRDWQTARDRRPR